MRSLDLLRVTFVIHMAWATTDAPSASPTLEPSAAPSLEPSFSLFVSNTLIDGCAGVCATESEPGVDVR